MKEVSLLDEIVMKKEEGMSLSEILSLPKNKKLTESEQENYKEIKKAINNRSPLATDANRNKLLSLVKNKEDLQKLRIGIGNRICASFMKQLGIEPGEKKDKDKEINKFLKTLCSEHKRITDAYTCNKSTVKSAIALLDKEGKLKYIKDMIDYNMIDSYIKLMESEEKNKNAIISEVQKHPMYNYFFKNIFGVGPEIAAVCLALFDPYKARHSSSFISFAGLNPVTVYSEDEDGNLEEKLIGNCKKYTEVTEILDKDGKIVDKKGITYNPFLKTQLLGVMATNLIMLSIQKVYVTDDEGNWLDKNGNVTKNKDHRVDTGRRIVKGKYANAYIDFKRRKLNDGVERNGKHIEFMAKRYMAKQFVIDLWEAWRTMLGLPVSDRYELEFLGRAPHKWPNYSEYHISELKDAKEITED